MKNQIQCANCLCTLYFVDQGIWGVTGELCDSCRKEEEDNYDDDDD